MNEPHLGHSDTLTPDVIGISKDVLILHCDHNNKEGGVALIVNMNLNPKQIRMNTILKIVAIKISEPIQMIVVSVYRPPSTPIDVFMNNMFAHHCSISALMKMSQLHQIPTVVQCSDYKPFSKWSTDT